MGWAIFSSIERHAKIVGGGYSGVRDVTTPAHRPLQYTGRMESFFTAETLKYLWLLFGDGSHVPLDQYVLNTEAHPILIHKDYRWGGQWGSLPDVSELTQAIHNETSRHAAERAEMRHFAAARIRALEQLSHH